MKSVPVTTEGYETMNLQKPIWVRSPRQVNESEYRVLQEHVQGV